MSLSIIAAIDLNGVIGKDNTVPWHLPADLKHFKYKTQDHIVVMGRKTYESLGKPLVNRLNIVLSNDKNYKADGCLVLHFTDAFIINKLLPNSEIFIIGGSKIYELFLPYADKLYITQIFEKFEGDSLFPKIDWNEWCLTSSLLNLPNEENKYQLTFNTYRRNNG